MNCAAKQGARTVTLQREDMIRYMRREGERPIGPAVLSGRLRRGNARASCIGNHLAGRSLTLNEVASRSESCIADNGKAARLGWFVALTLRLLPAQQS